MFTVTLITWKGVYHYYTFTSGDRNEAIAEAKEWAENQEVHPVFTVCRDGLIM